MRWLKIHTNSVFENSRKSLILQHLKKQKGFEKMVYGQAVLPDMSILIWQKLVENAKIKKFKCDNLGDFQTLWNR